MLCGNGGAISVQKGGADKHFQYIIFVAKKYKYNVFVANICKCVIYESFGWSFCGVRKAANFCQAI